MVLPAKRPSPEAYGKSADAASSSGDVALSVVKTVEAYPGKEVGEVATTTDASPQLLRYEPGRLVISPSAGGQLYLTDVLTLESLCIPVELLRPHLVLDGDTGRAAVVPGALVMSQVSRSIRA